MSLASIATTVGNGIVEFGPKLLHLAVDAIKSVEGLFGSGNGATKKQLVLNLLNDAVSALGVVTGTAGSSVKDALSKAVDDIVALFNLIGVFTTVAAAV